MGVGEGDRVGTFMWNNQTHLEAYLAMPCMGAVLHTLNIRLFPEQLAYVINHAEDSVIIVDASIVPLLAKVRDQLTTVEHIIVKGSGDASALGETLDYDDAARSRTAGLRLPRPRRARRDGDVLHERHHRQSQGRDVQPSQHVPALGDGHVHRQHRPQPRRDRMLVIVPMFHANAWGTPYAAWMIGADLVFPQQFLQAAPLARIIEDTRRR